VERYIRPIELHRQARGSSRSVIERVLLVAGLIGIGVWLGSIVLLKFTQYSDSIRFDRQVSPPQAPLKVEPNELIGRLRIPRLELSAMVREGDGDDTLRVALGHVSDTALPGQPGNVGIAGHRDTLFRPLRNIRKNDLIELETMAGNFTYRVDSTRIVSPREVSVLAPGPRRELTLVTCYPFNYVGSAPKRFIVKASEVAEPSTRNRDGSQAGTAELGGVDGAVGDMKDARKTLLPREVGDRHVLP
jgi:sortase A